MKTGTSSASFARAIAAAELTQLEWLDLCANELEVDGVVFAAEQFPRLDDEYLAQLKKFAVDLGLSVAALSADAFAPDGERWLGVAARLGAPLLVASPHPAAPDAGAWGRFTEIVAVRARQAKAANVTLAVRNAAGTLCAGVADLRRLAKDVDSAWLRYSLDVSAFSGLEPAAEILPKCVIAFHEIERLTTFGTAADGSARTLIDELTRFRGFVVLESSDENAANGAYHDAIERFAATRAAALSAVAAV